MENGEEEGKGPASAFEAMKKRFEQQKQGENNIIKPAVTPKPKVGKLGGGGELNIFGSNKPEVTPIKPGVNRPGNIVTPRDKSPNAPAQDGPQKKRNSSISIPAAFQEQNTGNSPLPPLKPKPKPEPKLKSDANNNADPPVTGTKPAISQMKPAMKSPGFPKTGSTSPRDGPQISPRSNTDNVSPRGGQVAAMAKAMQGISAADLKKNLKPTVKPSANKPNEFPAKKVPVNVRGKDGDSSNSTIELRSKFGAKGGFTRRSVKSVIRSSDNKKFRKDSSDFDKCGDAPDKPDKLDCEVDIDDLMEEFKKQLKALESDSKSHDVTEVEEEEYDDVANIMPKRAVSLIQPMTEDEEGEWEEAGFPGLQEGQEEFPPPPDETYDDAFTAPIKPEEEDADDLYEPLPDEGELPAEPPPPSGPKPPAALPPPHVPESHRKNSEPEPPTPPPTTPKSKESKESEKERKKREKEERERKKKEEQMQQKKEAELKKLLKSFEITAEEIVKSVGKGTIKKGAKAGDKKGLAVTEGEKVDIIRMVNSKAKGKWLVRLDNTEKVRQGVHVTYSPDELIGYVDAVNIEVDTDAIRGLMENKGGNSVSTTSPTSPVQTPQEDQELYEPVDDDLPNGVSGYEEDEIYEECN